MRENIAGGEQRTAECRPYRRVRMADVGIGPYGFEPQFLKEGIVFMRR